MCIFSPIIIIYNYPALTLLSAPGSRSFSLLFSRTMETRQRKMSAAELLVRKMIMMGSKRAEEWDLVASIKSPGQLFLHHIHHGLLGRHWEISGFSSTWTWFNEVKLCSTKRTQKGIVEIHFCCYRIESLILSHWCNFIMCVILWNVSWKTWVEK